MIGVQRPERRRAQGGSAGADDEQGQALIIAVFALAIAATAVIGLRAAQARLLTGAGDESAGEAAVEAAASVYADAAFARHRGGPSRDPGLADPAVVDAARAAAMDAARANGRDAPVEPHATVGAGVIDVELRLAGRRYRADVPVTCCPR